MKETKPSRCADPRCRALYGAAVAARRAAFEWFMSRKKKAAVSPAAGKGNE